MQVQKKKNQLKKTQTLPHILMRLLRLNSPVKFCFFRSCECVSSLSLLSPVWCTQKRNGRKSGMNCWSSPPVSRGSITAPTAPLGTVNSSHNTEPVEPLHSQSHISFLNAETVTNVNRVISLIPTLLFFIFVFFHIVTKRCIKTDFYSRTVLLSSGWNPQMNRFMRV